MTGPKNVLPFFIILVFEILLFLYTQKGLSKKNSWMQNALWGILTWQPCGSHVIVTRDVTRDVKHRVLSKHKNCRFSDSRSFFFFFGLDILLVPIIIGAIFSERYSVYVLVSRYSWHQDHCQFFLFTDQYCPCCKILHLNFSKHFSEYPKI